MSSFNLGKKLRPANKGWKSFTNILQSNLRKLQTSKSLNEITRRLKSALSRLIRPCLRALAGYRHRHGSRCRHCLRMNFAAIYVDELFARPGPVPLQTEQIQKVPTGKMNGMDAGPGPVQLQAQQIQKGSTSKMNEMRAGSSSTASASSSLPRCLGIDERAEEFISKFREDMKLERDQSILEFQEMLARSV